MLVLILAPTVVHRPLHRGRTVPIRACPPVIRRAFHALIPPPATATPPRAGQGGDGAPDALTTPKKDTPVGDALGGDKQPHSGKHAAHTPTTHADEAADTTKAVHSSGDAHGSWP